MTWEWPTAETEVGYIRKTSTDDTQDTYKAWEVLTVTPDNDGNPTNADDTEVILRTIATGNKSEPKLNQANGK